MTQGTNGERPKATNTTTDKSVEFFKWVLWILGNTITNGKLWEWETSRMQQKQLEKERQNYINTLSEADLLKLEEKVEGRNLINLILFRWSKYGFDENYIFFHNKMHIGLYYTGKSSLQEMNEKEKWIMLDQFYFRSFYVENDYRTLCELTQKYLEIKWNGAKNIGMPFGNWLSIPDKPGDLFYVGDLHALWSTRKYVDFITRCIKKTKEQHAEGYIISPKK